MSHQHDHDCAVRLAQLRDLVRRCEAEIRQEIAQIRAHASDPPPDPDPIYVRQREETR